MRMKSCVLSYAAAALLCGAVLAQYPAGSPGAAAPGAQSPATPPSGVPNGPGVIPEGPMPGSNPEIVMSDKSFVKRAADQNATDVELAKLAEEKGSSDAVKEFGKRVVEDHQKDNPALATAAAKVNVDVPTELPHSAKKTRDKLAKLSGPDFDRAYAKLMLNEQKDNVQLFTQEAQVGQIPEVKGYAAKTLPTVEQHKKMAEELTASVKK